MPKVFKLWASRWWVAHQLLRQGVSVLSLDTDAALFNDVYPLLHAPPLGAHDVLISKNGDASGSLNCGFVYFNLHASGGGGGGGGGGGAAGGGGAEPCGQRGCASCASGHSEAADSEAAATAGSERVVPAAEWAALVLWERFTLFLEIDRASLRRPPSSQVCEGAVGGMHGQCIPHVRCIYFPRPQVLWGQDLRNMYIPQVLWEQDMWNDVAKSLELNRRYTPLQFLRTP